MLEEVKEKYDEIAQRKRAELEASLEQGLVADPFGGILVTLALSAALSTASYFISRAFAPKVPRQELGKLSGTLQLQNSEQGIFIPEIYGAGPSISLVTGSDPTWQNATNVSTGAGGSITKNAGGSTWNAGASHNTAVNSGDEAFFQFTVGTGYATAGFATIANPTDGGNHFKFAVQWNTDGAVSIKYNNTGSLANVTTWVTGDQFRVELRAGRFRLYKITTGVSAEIIPQNFVFPIPTYPLYMGIAIQFIGAGVSASKVKINSIGDTPNAGRGGVKVPAIIVWSSGIRKHVTTTTQQTGGGKGGGGRTQTVDNITYDIDLGLMFANRGPYNLIREYANADILIDQYVQSDNPSGVYDPTTGADPTYDPTVPPDPQINYPTSNFRVDGDITYSGGAAAGTIQGGGSAFKVYQGTSTQAVDPVIEADIDARYGTGSTPAYRNKSLVRHTALDLSRWGGIVPNITAVWEHTTLKTLDAIYGAMCERVGVLAANSDYSFTGLSAIKSRGLLIAGRAYAPAEVIDDEEIKIAYSYFVTEAEGQIVGYVEGAEPSVTIPDTEVGWLDGDEDLPDIAPEVDTSLVSEITLPREVIVKSLDPDRDWEPDTQNAIRQVTDGQQVELLEVQIVQLADERRATAQRALYKKYVAGSAHKFTLSWKYMYLHPGYRITITRAEGFSHVLRLEKITGGIGLLECEGIALEPSVFIQPANGVFPPGYIPSQAVPAMTVVMFLDTPLLRDGDITNNNGVGQYVVGVPRTGVNQNWQGYALYINRNNEWLIVANSRLAGTLGTIVTVNSLSTNPDVIDTVGSITVDLYGTTATLSSVADADIALNMAVAGDMVFNFATATQVGGFPNRWTLTRLKNGIKNTTSHISAVGAGDRFAFVDNAVTFYPLEDEDINTSRQYRAVSVGQSLEDAAIVTHAYAANGLKGNPVTSISGSFDLASGSLLLDWVDPLAFNAEDSYEVIIRSAADGGGTVKRGPLPVKPLDLQRISTTPPLKALKPSSDYLDLSSYTYISPGGVDIEYTNAEWHTDGLSALVESESTFQIEGGVVIEIQAPSDVDPMFPSFMGVTQTTVGPNKAGWTTNKPGIIDPGATWLDPAPFHIIARGDRFSIHVQPDGAVVYYVNYMGALSDPFHVSKTKLDLSLTYKLQFFNQVLGWSGIIPSAPVLRIRNVRWLRNLPEYVYSDEQQKEDNSGSLPTTIHVGVRKNSSHPLGPPSDWVYASFTRP